MTPPSAATASPLVLIYRAAHDITSPTVFPALLAEVVVNDFADFSGGSNIFANLYADDVRLGTDTVVRKVGGAGGNVRVHEHLHCACRGRSGGDVDTPSTKTFGTIALTSGVSFTATAPTSRSIATWIFCSSLPDPRIPTARCLPPNNPRRCD